MTSLVKVLVQGPASCSGLLSPSTLKIAMERTSDVEEETQVRPGSTSGLLCDLGQVTSLSGLSDCLCITSGDLTTFGH